jgi:4-hydroxymandelate oxidase
VLPEIVKAVGGKAPVIVDGGIRRGSDAFKALALGATAVGIGRPYIWGLGAFGQPGVEAAMRLLDEELTQAMRQCGVTRIADITRARVRALRS